MWKLLKLTDYRQFPKNTDMAIINTEIIHESPFYLSEARRYIHDVNSIKTLQDWVERGRLRYKDRGKATKKTERVYLEVVALPGGLATSLAAYERFLMELNT